MFGKLLLYFALLLWFVVPSEAQPTIIFPDQKVNQNDRIKVDVKLNGFDSLVVVQFPVVWDPDVLDFVEVDTAYISSTLGGFNGGGVDTGSLIFVWSENNVEPVTHPDSFTIFTLTFDVIGAPGSASQLMSDREIGSIEIGGLDGPADTVFLENGMVTVMISTSIDALNASALSLHQNYPNPFSGQTRIPFDLRTAGDVGLRVFDAHGRTIFNQNNRFGVGSHFITIDQQQLGTPGTYWYELTTGEAVLTRQMVFVK